jgi:penicillin amidase
VINWIKWLVVGAIALLAVVAAVAYTTLYLSLPRLEGNSSTYHVAQPTQLSRDSLGHAVINAEGILDAAYALGFAHAQDRFFQMDLQRRAASGNLSDWVGKAALEIDKNARFHQFEQRAQAVFDNLPSKQQELLIRYSHGVNEALNEFTTLPFEYIAAGVEITQWRPTDSILVIYSMYLDLQGGQVNLDLARTALKDTFGEEIYRFITQPSHYQAALDGSELPLSDAPVPEYPNILSQANDTVSVTHINQNRYSYDGTELPDIGSNNYAVSGELTATGAGLLANDMHLSLRVPIIWYRAQLNYSEAGENISVTGVSLPGLPGIVVGTNGHIAWGFTNANLDNVDWVALNSDTPTTTVTQTIPLPGTYNESADSESADHASAGHEFTMEMSEFGPVKTINGKRYALNWVAHHDFAANLAIVDFGRVKTVDDALLIARKIAIPTQNLVVVDSKGSGAWTPGGAVLNREKASYTAISEEQMRNNTPQPAVSLPVVKNPFSKRIWTANARVISAEDLPRLGDGGYALGARGQQIRERLFEKDRFTETDFYAIQLDNHAQFLIPWHNLLSGLLTMHNVEFKPDLSYLNTWGACACEDSVGYTLVKHFRREVVQMLFGEILSTLDKQGVQSRSLLRGIEPATWQLIHNQPNSWLPHGTDTFDELLVDAYRRAKNKLLDKYSPLEANMDTLRWGSVNKLKVKHPFSAQIPFFGDMLNMDEVEGFGDTYMPAVQSTGFGASQRFFASPGHLEKAILTLPGGQSGHPLSEFFTAGFNDYATQAATPLLPGEPIYSRTFYKKEEE